MGYDRTHGRLNGYHQEVYFALDAGEGPVLRETRERLVSDDLLPEETSELQVLDAVVVDSVIQFDAIADYLLADNPTQPLSKWWWHLGKLRAGLYPAELLPEHLRAVYREALAHPAA